MGHYGTMIESMEALLGRLGLVLGVLGGFTPCPHVYSLVFEEFLSAFLACHPPKTE